MAARPATIIDAHHHLWDLDACSYPWLMKKGIKRFFGDPTPIQKNYLLEDYLAESPLYRPDKSVHIQVGVDSGDELNETEWLQSLPGFPHAIVAAADLTDTHLQHHLDKQLMHNRVRGIRQIVGRHVEEDKKHGSDALLEDARFVSGLKTLAATELTFDLQMIPQQMPRVIAMLKKVPQLKVALCHCGSPWDQSADGLAQWADGLRQLAELPNTVCKVSGLGMFNPHWDEAALHPIVLTVIDIFQPQRVMFGSNFPVDKLYNDYAALWAAYDSITQGFSAEQRDQMFGGTAGQFYRI